MAEAIASRESSMAPRTDSSASRLWGGTRPVVPAPPARGVSRRWGRVSSKAWTIVGQPSPIGPVERKGIFLRKLMPPTVDGPWITPARLRTRRGMGTSSQVGVTPSRTEGTARAPSRPPGRAPPRPGPGRGRGIWSVARNGSAGRRSGSGFGDHVDRELENHATHQLDAHVVLTHRLDRLLEHQVVTVDDRPGLLLDVAHDVGRADRPEQLVVGGPGGDGDGVAHQGLGHGLGSLTVPRVLQVTRMPHGGGLHLDAVRGDDGLAGRQEVVTGEAAGDVNDVAALADPVHVRAEQDLHDSSPASSTMTISSPVSSSTTSTSTTSTTSTAASGSSGGVPSGMAVDAPSSPRVRSSSRPRRPPPPAKPPSRPPRPPRPPGRSVVVRWV